MKSLKYLLLILLISGYLSSCNPLINLAQPIQTDTVTISPNANVGQTLMATYRGLEGIGVYLFPQPASEGYLRLHLRASPDSNYDLQVTDIPLAKIKKPQFISFQFSPQADSFKKDYYFFIELLGRGEVAIAKTAGDAYLNGAMYVNHTAEDAQLTFRLKYDRYQAFIGICREVLSWLWFTLIGILLYILPGWALLSLLYQNWTGLSWGEKLGLSAGMSLAIYPILMLWTNLVGLHLGAFYAWIPVAFGIITISCKNKRHLNITSLKFSYTQNTIPDLAFFIVIGMVLAVRFWVIRTLDAPMWGDSYQHTVISQLLVDHNGLFTSWEPYADLTTFTYHFGFHSAVAAFYWLTHQIMPQSVLWVGQILNALAVIALYPLATRVGGNRWAGVGAVIVAGLLSPMPMYYVNWGRYTQLAGQVILPGAIYLAWATLEAKPPRIESTVVAGSYWSKWRLRIPFDVGRMALMWLVLGGLALTHYRVLIFGLLFFVAFFILRVRRDIWRALLARTFWMGIGAGLLFIPWFIHTFTGKIMLIFAKQLSTPVAAVSTWTQQYNAIGDLSSYLPAPLWLLLPVSIIWGLWRREKGVALISLWSFLVLLAANPQWLRLPGEGALSNFAIFIAAYIPVSVLVGYMLGQATSYKSQVTSARKDQNLLPQSPQSVTKESKKLKTGFPSCYFVLFVVNKFVSSLNVTLSNKSQVTSEHKSLWLAILISVFVVGVWGGRARLGDLQVMPHALATRPDIRAAEWIQENTPQDARFLVNSFFAYGDTVIVGSDGGWWLPLLAQRQTTLPPLNYGSERGPLPDYVHWINALTTEIQNKGFAHPDVLALLRARGITYVYIGQRQGRVNYSGPYVLEPEQLLASPNFRLVYHQDRAWVFEVQR